MSAWFSRHPAPPAVPVTPESVQPEPPALPPMAERLAAWHEGAPLVLAPLSMVHATIRGRPVAFCHNFTDDPIQNAQRRGRFYEGAELARLAALVPPGGTVLDVGANIGNHALYLAMFTGAAKVIVVEPNPLALEPLVGAVLANRLEGLIDLGHLGFGLGEADSGGWGMKKHDRNLGATKMFAGQGALEVRRGDTAFPTLTPDLVKIDVEGMEMAVLRGLEGLIARARPALMVEVHADHAEEFSRWAEAHAYTVERLGEGPRYANNLALPAEGAAPQ